MVVDVPGDARPILFEVALVFQVHQFAAQPPMAGITGNARGARDQRQPQQRKKPRRFPKMRQHLQVNCGSGFIPNAVVVAGRDVETINSGLQIIILRPAPRTGVNPIGIKSFELAAETNFIRVRSTKARYK